ncbi:MAG: metal ABC transporter permease [Defluviimonas sp.]|nr:metal ABC transporter permease [Paracoccaceae bacterium]MCC0062598.1 metal ABC transporter permease [Defluviimonas sp.]
MVEPFLLRAAAAGIGLLLAAGPLGAFVVWRRMAYMGDATAHAAILGVAIALATDLPIGIGIVMVGLAVALAVTALSGARRAADTALGVLAHAALAIGLVAVSFLPGVRVNLETYLFGDILAVSIRDLIWIWAGSVAVLALLVWRWNALLTATVNEELARAAGLDPRREGLVLSLALALVVAVAIKIVGALLVAALLIIPAAAARSLARSPEAMALWAAVLGSVAVIAGLWASLRFDTPSGPSIVTAAALIFALCLIVARRAD